MAGVESFYGDVLGETAEESLEFNQFDFILAATDDDAYNALVYANYSPTIGRGHVLVLNPGNDRSEYLPGLNGEVVFGELDFWEIADHARQGWSFVAPKITDEASLDRIVEMRGGEFVPLLLKSENGRIAFFSDKKAPKGEPGDIAVGIGRPMPAPAEKTREADQNEPEEQ